MTRMLLIGFVLAQTVGCQMTASFYVEKEIDPTCKSRAEVVFKRDFGGPFHEKSTHYGGAEQKTAPGLPPVRSATY
jgi:hypothetical protein